MASELVSQLVFTQACTPSTEVTNLFFVASTQISTRCQVPADMLGPAPYSVSPVRSVEPRICVLPQPVASHTLISGALFQKRKNLPDWVFAGIMNLTVV